MQLVNENVFNFIFKDILEQSDLQKGSFHKTLVAIKCFFKNKSGVMKKLACVKFRTLVS